MNFYEYHDPTEKLEADPIYLAAQSIIEHGGQVIPLIKGDKAPARIKDVYRIISHPIHLGEHGMFDYHFKDANCDLGLILSDDMEFLDVDEKYRPGIVKEFTAAIAQGWPELYEKLVIHQTGSGGAHFIYRSEIVGGQRALARRNATPNPLAIIERISKANNQYIKIPPSAGYTCLQGNPLDVKAITAEERNWLSAVAMSFNEIHVPEVKQAEAEREDSPWFVFNSQNNWRYIRDQLTDRGWSVVGENDKKIIVNRPGGTGHRSSGYIYKDISILYLHTTSSEFENGKAYSPFGVYAMFHHDGSIASACKSLASEGIGVNIFNEGEFWTKVRSKIQIKYTDLLRWYHTIGYRTYRGQVVQVIDNIVAISAENDMIKAFLSEVEFQVRDEMYEKVPTIFKEKGGLMAMLTELEDNFIQDTVSDTWLFFRNLAIKITDTGNEPFEYKNLKGYIWKSSIIQRDFYETPHEGCDAHRFIDILGGDKAHDLQKIIGYMVSRYKDPLNAKAAILMEDIEPDEEGDSQGGSGKSLCFQFIKQYRKTVELDGRNFRLSDPFLFQNVDIDTSVILIDDLEKSFRFNGLFTMITGSLIVNKKNKAQIIIPYDQSAKIGITSNYSVGGMDMSSRRRKYEFAITKHFGEAVQPIDEFGRQFFNGWDRPEWLRFDNFITKCCAAYLADKNKKAIGNITGNSTERSLISNTNKDFIEYMDGQLHSNFFDFAPVMLKNATLFTSTGGVTTNAVDIARYRANIKNPDYYIYITKDAFYDKIQKLTHAKYLSTTRLTQWLKRWSESRHITIDSSYKREADGERCYRFIDWPDRSESDQFSKKAEVGTGNTEVGTGWKPVDDWDPPEES